MCHWSLTQCPWCHPEKLQHLLAMALNCHLNLNLKSTCWDDFTPLQITCSLVASKLLFDAKKMSLSHRYSSESLYDHWLAHRSHYCHVCRPFRKRYQHPCRLDRPWRLHRLSRSHNFQSIDSNSLLNLEISSWLLFYLDFSNRFSEQTQTCPACFDDLSISEPQQ